MSIPILKYTGEQVGRDIILPNEIFGVTPNDHAIYLDVRVILSNRRQGTHKVKGRSEVRGSRRKIRRQKGTGNARVGDIKSPLCRENYCVAKMWKSRRYEWNNCRNDVVWE